jgi:hypothetical protein
MLGQPCSTKIDWAFPFFIASHRITGDREQSGRKTRVWLAEVNDWNLQSMWRRCVRVSTSLIFYVLFCLFSYEENALTLTVWPFESDSWKSEMIHHALKLKHCQACLLAQAHIIHLPKSFLALGTLAEQSSNVSESPVFFFCQTNCSSRLMCTVQDYAVYYKRSNCHVTIKSLRPPLEKVVGDP